MTAGAISLFVDANRLIYATDHNAGLSIIEFEGQGRIGGFTDH